LLPVQHASILTDFVDLCIAGNDCIPQVALPLLSLLLLDWCIRENEIVRRVVTMKIVFQCLFPIVTIFLHFKMWLHTKLTFD
jgi:Na+-transporting methylmalonyl-CoA/oxaloacetate decarboxylase beta subunit